MKEKTVNSIPCKVKKLRPNAQLPVRATATAAGYDVTFCPLKPNGECTSWQCETGGVYAFHTGLAFEMPADVAMLVLPRSGLASKRQLRPANTPGLVDSDYRGELIVMMENFGTELQIIEPGERIAQLVFINPLVMDFTEVDELSETNRGDGGFGSTGTK